MLKTILTVAIVSTSLLFTNTVKAESPDIVVPENAIQISKYVISIDGKEYSNDNGIWYLDGVPTELPTKPEVEQPTNAVTEPILIDKEEPSNLPKEPTEKEQPKVDEEIPTKLQEKDGQENVTTIPNASDTKVVVKPLTSSSVNTLPPTGDNTTLALVVTGIIFAVVGLIALIYITIGAVFLKVLTSIFFGGRKK